MHHPIHFSFPWHILFSLPWCNPQPPNPYPNFPSKFLSIIQVIRNLNLSLSFSREKSQFISRKVRWLHSVFLILCSYLSLLQHLHIFQNVYLAAPVLVVALRRFIFIAAHRIFSCSILDLIPLPGIKPGPPALEEQSLSHWTAREVSALAYCMLLVCPLISNISKGSSDSRWQLGRSWTYLLPKTQNAYATTSYMLKGKNCLIHYSFIPRIAIQLLPPSTRNTHLLRSKTSFQMDKSRFSSKIIKS